MDDKVLSTTSFTNMRKTRIVKKRHILYIYQDPSIGMTGMYFWRVLCTSLVHFKNSFLRH